LYDPVVRHAPRAEAQVVTGRPCHFAHSLNGLLVLFLQKNHCIWPGFGVLHATSPSHTLAYRVSCEMVLPSAFCVAGHVSW
jgi:hypothetical protein